MPGGICTVTILSASNFQCRLSRYADPTRTGPSGDGVCRVCVRVEEKRVREFSLPLSYVLRLLVAHFNKEYGSHRCCSCFYVVTEHVRAGLSV